MTQHRFLKALKRQPVDKTPVWLMRQAGRYLPEYRKLRAEAGSFLALCTQPDLACEVTLQPLKRFDLDAGILFSDILTIPDAMGLGLYFVEGEGPKFKRPLRCEKDILALPVIDPELSLTYVLDTVRLVKKALKNSRPLIGFSGSPWTLACYMIEGQARREFPQAKKMLHCEPQLLHHLLETLSQSISAYLNAQIAAGAQAVMIFDTWGGILSTPDYLNFSLYYMQRIIDNLHRGEGEERVPVILFTKHGGHWLEPLAKTGCDAIGVDWTLDIGRARERAGNQVALQGNLDPSILLAPPEKIKKDVRRILADFGPHPGHIFNLGHGILQQTPPEHVRVLVEAVHENQPGKLS
jgi:uroporphyrinogen decarboxylase